MHYRHAYHAANFADVFKHTVLLALLEALSRKDKPWCYLETHAGAGRYDLQSAEALATGEAADGIGRLQGLATATLPPLLQRYLAVIAAANAPETGTRYYPGSPSFAFAAKRPGDRIVLCEQVAEVAAALRSAAPGAEVHQRDGYTAFSLLPPPEKRALVLVDAAFERRDEFDAMLELVEKSQARFPSGVYALWYPIKNRHLVERFRRRLGKQSSKPVLDVVLETGAPPDQQMVGCGVTVVNPPFGLDTELSPSLQVLSERLAASRAAEASLAWLKTEAECVATVAPKARR